MTQTWDCVEARPSLGVYVLGAIDPAERGLVDAHLTTCRDCRDELAGLAGLPALLARVNPDEISRIRADEVSEQTGRLLRQTRAERAALGVMHPGRVDVIGGGALVLDRLMRRFGFAEVLVSEHDILDGIAWSLVL